MPIKWPIHWDLRTSETHPLQIDWITSELFTGRIGITLCPGKYQPVSWTGGWNRSLDADICAIDDSGATTVVSLVEECEMDILRVPGLGKSIQEYGIDWIHLPFKDTTAPNLKWMQEFASVAPSIIASIKKGDSIVVHCKGGLSRAGTVVALLLWSMGIKISSAIHLIRSVRSGECINSVQEKFLASATKQHQGC